MRFTEVCTHIFELVRDPLCLRDVRGSGSCICHRRRYAEHTDRASVSALHFPDRCVYLCGCHIRDRSGAESSIRTVHLHYRGTADRIYSQYHLRLIGNLGSCGEYDKGRAAVGDALYSAFLYGTFQLSNIAVFVQHAKSFDRPGDAVKSMGVGFVVNALMMVMVVLGLMTVYTNPDAAGQSVPTLFMVQNGVGASFMTPLISILIILGAVSTAVNMVAAMVKRICGEKEDKASGEGERTSGEAGGAEKPAGKRRFQGYAKRDYCSAHLLYCGFRDRPVRAAYPDPESVQFSCLPGDTGYSYSIYYSYDSDKI